MSRYYRDHTGILKEDRRVDERRYDYCDMVISNNRELGAMSERLDGIDDHLAAIRKAVSNGLSEKLKTCEDRLTTFEKNTWIVAILNSGVKKFLVGLLLLILTAASNASMWMLFKTSIYKETPRQLQRLSDTIMANGYMLHTTAEGYKVMTANDSNKKAWIYDEKKNEWQLAPQYRVVNK